HQLHNPSYLLSLTRPPPRATLFPYTTLFRSRRYDAIAGSNNYERRHNGSEGRMAEERFPRRDFLKVTASTAREAFFRHPSLASRSEEHTSELQSLTNLVCRLLLEIKNKKAHA